MPSSFHPYCINSASGCGVSESHHKLPEASQKANILTAEAEDIAIKAGKSDGSSHGGALGCWFICEVRKCNTAVEDATAPSSAEEVISAAFPNKHKMSKDQKD